MIFIRIFDLINPCTSDLAGTGSIYVCEYVCAVCGQVAKITKDEGDFQSSMVVDARCYHSNGNGTGIGVTLFVLYSISSKSAIILRVGTILCGDSDKNKCCNSQCKSILNTKNGGAL